MVGGGELVGHLEAGFEGGGFVAVVGAVEPDESGSGGGDLTGVGFGEGAGVLEAGDGVADLIEAGEVFLRGEEDEPGLASFVGGAVLDDFDAAGTAAWRAWR